MRKFTSTLTPEDNRHFLGIDPVASQFCTLPETVQILRDVET